MPTELSSFVGREAELAAVERLVGEHRLVTLTGPGGVGKTRLAVRVAADLGRPVPGRGLVRRPGAGGGRAVGPVVALTALGVAEDKHRDHRAMLLAHLARRELALVLDSCEHVVDVAARLASEVVAACPGVHVVATSREPLAVPGEAVYRVPSLAAPEPLPLVDGATVSSLSVDDVAGFPAVRLFVERGRAAEPSFALTNGNAPAVAQICRRLDGIPLAIELAAARLRAMTPAEIAERLDDRFRLLTAGSRVAVPRQQTLEALIDWSHGLLTDDGAAGVPPAVGVRRRVGTRRSPGGLRDRPRPRGGRDRGRPARLIDRSLVVASTDGATTRFRMLETIRAYAADRLDAAGETAPVRTAALAIPRRQLAMHPFCLTDESHRTALICITNNRTERCVVLRCPSAHGSCRMFKRGPQSTRVRCRRVGRGDRGAGGHQRWRPVPAGQRFLGQPAVVEHEQRPCAPLLDAALEGAELAIREDARVPMLQLLEQSQGGLRGIGVE